MRPRRVVAVRRFAKNLGVSAAVVILAGLLQPSGRAAGAEEQALEACRELMRDGDYAVRQRLHQQAVEAYSAAIECRGEPTHGLAYSLARALMEIGRFDRAESMARTAIAAAESEAMAEAREVSVNLLANILADRVRWRLEPIADEQRQAGLRAAEQTFRDAIDAADEESGLKSSTRSVGWFNLATLLAAQGRLSEAGAAASSYLARQPRGAFSGPARRLVECAERLADSPEPSVLEVESVAAPVQRRPAPVRPVGDAAPETADEVMLEAVIDRCGNVRSLRAGPGAEPALARAAMRAARWWWFEPVERDGSPQVVRGQLAVSFGSR